MLIIIRGKYDSCFDFYMPVLARGMSRKNIFLPFFTVLLSFLKIENFWTILRKAKLGQIIE